MSFLAYNHVYIQLLEEAAAEFVKLYFESAGEEPSFVTAVGLSYLLDMKFLVGAPYKLYIETVSNVYWIIRIIADPGKDASVVHQYMRMFNPFLKTYDKEDADQSETEKLFIQLIAEYKLNQSASASPRASASASASASSSASATVNDQEKEQLDSEPTLEELELRCKDYDPTKIGQDPELDDAMELLWHKREIAFTENFQNLCKDYDSKGIWAVTTDM
jgi:hypothetical protein